jgi:rhodanese-related sulfurtransferase
MNLISREELKGKLDRGDQFVLVNALGEWAFRAKRIPGSIHYSSPEEALQSLKPDQEIVVYCSNPDCPASIYAYRVLEMRGYQHLWRYAGGLEDWEKAGYPLEGEMIASPK